MQIFYELIVKTKGQGLYNFTKETIDWIKKQKIHSGILNLNILHLGRIVLEKNVIRDKVIYTINSLDDIENINKICSEINKRIRCHIKVDTGMNRMGCKMNEFNEILELAHKSDFINIEAIYSHLACSEDEYSENNKKQILSFNYIRNITKKYKLKEVIKLGLNNM